MNLKFGTGGLRATMGEGPDHLNIETIREATLGVAAYAKTLTEMPKLAIAYDSRLHSEEFAKETARVLAKQDCVAYIYPKLMPTPALSFAVRELSCDLGICITASHNPKDYNGYKVYGADGCQITGAVAKAIQKAITEVTSVGKATDKILVSGDSSSLQTDKAGTFDFYLRAGKIKYITEDVIDKFYKAILDCRLGDSSDTDLKVVYTPLNGAGMQCIPHILKTIGIKHLEIVPEQAEPDGNFPTCPYPNPEERKALDLGIALCEKTNADILLASDPDSDRIGIAAPKNGTWEQMSGNQTGVLLLDYILSERQRQKTLPKRPVMIKTIVTTSMAERIAEYYGAEVIDTLTGFKYIGEQIGKLEGRGELDRYIFGMEESCGYLIGGYVRDKDAVGAAMLICEMAAKYKAEGKTLWEKLEELYQTYGYYETELQTHRFTEAEAAEQMQRLRSALEEQKKGLKKVVIEEAEVLRFEDYSVGIKDLPKSDVIKLWLSDDSTMVIRPSGTEPKIKLYKERKINHE